MTRRIIGLLLSLVLLLAVAAPGLAAGAITYGPWVSAGSLDPLEFKREVFEDGKSAAWQKGMQDAGDPSIFDPWAFKIIRVDDDGNKVSEAMVLGDGFVTSETFFIEGGEESISYNRDGTPRTRTKATVDGNTRTVVSTFEDGESEREIVIDTGSGHYSASLEKYTADGKLVYLKIGQPDGSTKVGAGGPPEYYETGIDPDHFRTRADAFSSDAEGNKRTEGLKVVYDQDGKFVWGTRYDPATDEWVDLKEPPSHDPWWVLWMEKPYMPVWRVWFPNNTASTMGLSLRDRKPGFTSKWYNVTPLDLSRQGVQVIPLIASNMYIVGDVRVKVEGDSVTVSYNMLGDDFDTARVHSEFLKLYPNLDAITSLEDAALTDGHAFNQPISIEKDLQGDTKVVMLVRNVLTYNLNYRGMRMLTRYWPNLAEHRAYRTQLEALLD